MLEAEIFRALADPTRRALFEQLHEREMSVSELTAGLSISQPAVSQHLAALRGAGLVTERREGRFAYYRAEPQGLTPVGLGRRGGAMPTLIGHHDVKDRDHWLASPKREEFFGPLGVTNIRTFVDPQNPTHVAVLMDVADMDAFQAAMQSEGAAEAMAYDGVLPETLVILVEA